MYEFWYLKYTRPKLQHEEHLYSTVLQPVQKRKNIAV